MASHKIFSQAFLKDAFNRFPDLITMSTAVIITIPFAFYKLHKDEKERPFTYRLYYTVWRQDDPRANQMVKKIEKYNWTPELKPDLKVIKRERANAGLPVE